jgi:hypothetical protein
MKPDRFEQMVQHEMALLPPYRKRGVIKLLRRQHAAMVRLVKRQKGYQQGVYIMLPHPDGAWLKYTDVLGALAQYKKGTP